jgi:hypothetical protein
MVPRNEDGQKSCLSCKVFKDEDHFSYDSRRADLKSLYCRACKRNMQANQRWATYGITQERFTELMEAQAGLCAICLCDITGETSKGKSAANIDHDHSCCAQGMSCGECVRGLLCLSCNMAIGYLKESAENIERALSYVLN